jgi:hypothetical protein
MELIEKSGQVDSRGLEKKIRFADMEMQGPCVHKHVHA